MPCLARRRCFGARSARLSGHYSEFCLLSSEFSPGARARSPSSLHPEPRTLNPQRDATLATLCNSFSTPRPHAHTPTRRHPPESSRFHPALNPFPSRFKPAFTPLPSRFCPGFFPPFRRPNSQLLLFLHFINSARTFFLLQPPPVGHTPLQVSSIQVFTFPIAQHPSSLCRSVTSSLPNKTNPPIEGKNPSSAPQSPFPSRPCPLFSTKQSQTPPFVASSLRRFPRPSAQHPPPSLRACVPPCLLHSFLPLPKPWGIFQSATPGPPSVQGPEYQKGPAGQPLEGAHVS